MLVFPNAKINFGLNVVAKRPDGFHNIETLFYPVHLHDMLEIKPSLTEYKDGFKFQNSGLLIDCAPEKNLVVKAFWSLNSIKKLPSVDILLHKTIPFGGGLGGGSSNGAFALALLNQLFSCALKEEDLLKMAEDLGSDCPFFIYNRPSFAFEKGNLLQPAPEVLKGFYILLVIPPVSVNTAKAYSQITPVKPETEIKEAIHLDPKDWKKYVRNDFEGPVFKAFPVVAAIKEQMYKMGAFYASMSGSGSSVYGLFEKEPDMDGFNKGENFIWKGIL